MIPLELRPLIGNRIYGCDDCLAVCESGLRTNDDLQKLRAVGFDAFLIGEHLMLAPDPAAALFQLLNPPAIV